MSTANGPAGASTGGWMLLQGVDGLLAGEVLALRAGQEATIGRGSGSTLPLTRSRGYRELSEDPATLRRTCQGVSRIHLRVRVPAPGELVVEDLSRTGTYVDGSRIPEPVHLRDLADRAHEIRFGRGETLEVRWAAGGAAGGTGADPSP